MTNTLTTIEEQFQPIRAILERNYEENGCADYAYLVHKYGTLTGRSWSVIERGTTDRARYSEVMRFTKKVDENDYNPKAPMELDPAKLIKLSKRWADEQLAFMIDKLHTKLGDLDEAKLHHEDGLRFLLTGKKDGAEIRIEQVGRINHSVRGTAYMQWPATIWVDGKKTSAAAYAKRFL